MKKQHFLHTDQVETGGRGTDHQIVEQNVLSSRMGLASEDSREDSLEKVREVREAP